jgi:hypothetical protein
MLVDIKEIKFKELAAAVAVLNESGLLKELIKTVGVTKEAIVKSFVAGVQSISDDKDGNWTGPQEAADYYGKIVIPDKTKEEEKSSKKKGSKAPKEKKEKVVKEKAISSLEVMQGLLEKKASDNEITKVFTERLRKKVPTASVDFIAKRIKIYKALAKK